MIPKHKSPARHTTHHITSAASILDQEERSLQEEEDDVAAAVHTKNQLSRQMFHPALRRTWRPLRQQWRGLSTLRVMLEEKVSEFPTKDVLRFYDQDIRWNMHQFKQHSEAVAHGLFQLGFLAGDATITSCLPADAENVGVAIGGALAGVNVAQVDGNVESSESLRKIIAATKCRGLVVPAAQIPILYEAIPELQSLPPVLDSTLDLEEFPELKYIFHTGQPTHRGTHRFKDILAYYCSLDLPLADNPNETVLSVVDAKSGAVKESFTEEQLVAKSQEAADALSLAADGRVMFTGKSISPALTIASIASALKLAKLVVPSHGFSTDKMSSVQEVDPCHFAIGDSPPSGLKAWAP